MSSDPRPAEFEPTYSADDLDEPDCRYPVIVTIHHEHVVWIEAFSAADALARLKNDGEWYEHLNDRETLAEAWEEMSEPDRFNWDRVYGYGYSGNYDGLQCDLHVDVHKAVMRAEQRKAEQAACKAAGHPEVKEFVKQPYCNTCGYLSIDDLIADLRAVSHA